MIRLNCSDVRFSWSDIVMCTMPSKIGFFRAMTYIAMVICGRKVWAVLHVAAGRSMLFAEYFPKVAINL